MIVLHDIEVYSVLVFCLFKFQWAKKTSPWLHMSDLNFLLRDILASEFAVLDVRSNKWLEIDFISGIVETFLVNPSSGYPQDHLLLSFFLLSFERSEEISRSSVKYFKKEMTSADLLCGYQETNFGPKIMLNADYII